MLQPVRGTKDLIDADAVLFRYVIDTALAVAKRYMFKEIHTPIFEFTNVFKRTLGETSDVVSKEMYTFEDRGGESITLRPEGTAPVARAVISNGLTQNLPLKFIYAGPMFRYERPQKGRFRQFHQIGAELIGPSSPLSDAEVIKLSFDILKALGLDASVTLNLNTLGDVESRQHYREALVTYLTQYASELSSDSQERLEKNPLRILDSKDSKDQEILTGAPTLEAVLNDESRIHFESVQNALTQLGVQYRLNNKLVRGLDYYSHTAFEFITDELGAQGTVLGGGRYDGLMKQMGGPQTPAIGWAAGIERLCLMLENKQTIPQYSGITIVPTSENESSVAFALMNTLRESGLSVEMGYSGNMSKRLKKAAQNSSKVAIILGEEELKNNSALVKFLDAGTQETVSINQLTSFLEHKLI